MYAYNLLKEYAKFKNKVIKDYIECYDNILNF
jgi:hypothetical protein